MSESPEVPYGPENPTADWFASGTIDMRKFDEYLLCPTHPEGKGKLEKWRGAFGICEGDGQLLEQLIREQVLRAEIIEDSLEPYPPDPERFMRSFTVVIRDFRGPNGRIANVETAWALDPDEDAPHLVTAYPKWVSGERQRRRL
jgi:uncharacterized protein DUF6883